MLATLSTSLLHEVLSWVDFVDVIRVSVTSREMNSAITDAVDPRNSEGRQWWSGLLARDYGNALGYVHPPNQQYMAYIGRVIDRVHFAIWYNVAWILDVLGTGPVNNSPLDSQQIIELMDLNDPRVDTAVHRILQTSIMTPRDVSDAVYSVIIAGRLDVAKRALQNVSLLPGSLHIMTETLAYTYNLLPSPELLQFITQMLQRVDENMLMGLIFSFVESGSVQLLEVVLRMIPRESNGKIRSISINRNNGMILQNAARLGNPGVIRALISAGASPYTYKHAAFMKAASYNRVDAMKVLARYLSKSNPAVVSRDIQGPMNPEGRALITSLKTQGKLEYGTHILMK